MDLLAQADLVLHAGDLVAAAVLEELRAAFPGCSAVVYANTHVPQLERYDGVWIINPGSPTERRSAPTHSMALLQISQGSLEPTLVRL